MLGHLLELVDVAPVEDPLAVGLGARQHTRVGAGGDETASVSSVSLTGLGVDTSTRCSARPRISSESRPGPARSGRPRDQPPRMSADWAIASPLTRWLTVARSRWTVVSSAPFSPSTAESRTEVMVPAAAMRVFDGTQSVGTLAPPARPAR